MAARILGEDPRKVRRRIDRGELRARQEGPHASHEIPIEEIQRLLDMRRRAVLEAEALLDAVDSPNRSE